MASFAQTNKHVPLTSEAYAELTTKIARLQKEVQEAQKRVNEAREQGDLSENGAYKYGKLELGSLRRQLFQAERLLATAYVAQPETSQEIIGFGSIVTIQSQGIVATYTLVSHHESDIAARKLSLQSPLGKALCNKKEGDVVSVSAPKGVQEWRIMHVE